MNFLKVVGIGCLGCLGLLVVLGIAGFMFLPDDYEVKRTSEIAAPAATIFPLVDTPRRWSEWDPWTRMDPGISNTYSGPESGVGAKRSWTSTNENVGRGSFTIVESVPNVRVAFDLEIPEMQVRPRGTFVFEPIASGTRVTWTTSETLSGGYRMLALVAETFMGPTQESGLSNLKAVAEREASAGGELLEKTQPAVDDVLEPADGEADY